MNKVIKLLIGLITIIPFIYTVIFFLNFSNDIMDFDLMHKLHLGTMALIVGLLTFYISNVFRTDRIPNEKKTMWLIVIFFGHIIAMIIYWYLYIWKEPKEE